VIYLSEVETPLGVLAIAECKERFLAVVPGGLNGSPLISLRPRLEQWGALTLAVRRPLAQRFAVFLGGGERGRWSVDLSLAEGALARSVYQTLFRTRPGDLLTPVELAERIGRSTEVEAVEAALLKSPLLGVVPSHRVRKDGAPLGSPEEQVWAEFFAGLPDELEARAPCLR
jgi:O6-methylguanine-DNA--protein-cysteine methyltransferase